jgi:hypothetical protein
MTESQPARRATIPPINEAEALRWAAAGWRFFPCVDDPERPGKLKPALPGWQLPSGPATNNAEQIQAWCRDPAVRALGLPTWPVNNIAALDSDEKNGKSGSASLAKLGHVIPPETLQWPTLNNGKHALFAYPTDGRAVPTDASKLADGVDRRGEGGFLFFWPAHGMPVTGQTLAPAPEWFTVAPREAANDTPAPDRVGLSDEQLREFASRIEAAQFDDYDARVKLGMALHHESGGSELGRHLFNEVSKRAPKYSGEREIDAKWRSFGDHRSRVTLRTFLKQTPDIAAQAGTAARLQEWFGNQGTAVAQQPLPAGTPEAPTVAPGQICANQAYERFAKLLKAGTEIDGEGGDEPAEIIEGLVAAASQGCIYGPPGSAKTFCMTAMGFSIAEGIKFLGQEVEQGDVVYVAAEAARVVRDRMRAYRKETGRTLERFHILPTRVNLLDTDDVEGLVLLIEARAKAIGRPIKLAIIDTVARSMPGGNENSSEDMGRLVAAGDQINERTGAAVFFIHHSGKDIERGARGSNALLGAVDTEFQMSKDESGKVYTMLVTKQRDLPTEGLTIPFKLKPVPLRTNQWGKPIGSAIVVPLDGHETVPSRAASKPIIGTNQRGVMAAAREAIMLHGRKPGRRHDSVTLDEIREIFDKAKDGVLDPKQRSDAFRKGLDGLLAGQHLVREPADGSFLLPVR